MNYKSKLLESTTVIGAGCSLHRFDSSFDNFSWFTLCASKYSKTKLTDRLPQQSDK